MKILAIDDTHLNLMIVKRILEEHLPDAQLETADSGTAGIELARVLQPDTILLDLQMPVMDGFETIRHLKKDPITAYIPVIIITAANVASKDRVKALEMGADAFLQKPISSHELVAHIKVMLRIKKAEERLRHSHKLEAIGVLAGGVAHDFNNIMTIIKGYSTMLLMDMAPDSPYHESLQMIVDATNRASHLTQSLLTFSRKQEKIPLKEDLSVLIHNFEKFINRIIGDNITLELNSDKETSPVTVNRNMIEQMLMNLAINARDAMPEGGKLKITMSNALIDNKMASSLQISPELYVRLEVTDTGCGISDELLPKIFDPFFTTKEIGKGSGLGLSMVYGIVQQHNGAITVKSKPGEGTAFTIYLPVNRTTQIDS